MVATKKNAFGGLLLLVTLAIGCIAQAALPAFEPNESSYVYLARKNTLTDEPSPGNGALTLELSEKKDQAQLCYRGEPKTVGTHVEGDFSGSWTLNTALARSDGGSQDGEPEPIKISCETPCNRGCLGIDPNSPLVHAVTTYRGLSPVAGQKTNFEVTYLGPSGSMNAMADPAHELRVGFDSLTYEEPNKETTSKFTLIVPYFAALKTYQVKPLSTGTKENDPTPPIDMACLHPLDQTGKPLNETIWYWSTGPATGKALLSVDPTASWKNKVPNGCNIYDRKFNDEYIAKGAQLSGKVIWVATGGGTGTTMKLDHSYQPE